MHRLSPLPQTPAGPPSPPTVFVVDDDAQLRDSLCTLLGVLNYEVRSFNSPAAFQRFYRAEMPGCLLLDIRMPGQSGLELYDRLLSEGKKLPVIFITAHADVSTAVAAMKSGAVEFLEKPFDRDTLIIRVEKALSIDAQWRRDEATFGTLDARLGQLTVREQETLSLFQSGATNKAIASQLRITERAVEMRRASIMRKLNVHSAAEVIDLATAHRILKDLRRAAVLNRLD